VVRVLRQSDAHVGWKQRNTRTLKHRQQHYGKSSLRNYQRVTRADSRRVKSGDYSLPYPPAKVLTVGDGQLLCLIGAVIATVAASSTSTKVSAREALAQTVIAEDPPADSAIWLAQLRTDWHSKLAQFRHSYGITADELRPNQATTVAARGHLSKALGQRAKAHNRR